MLLLFQSSGLCVQSPSIPVPGYPLFLVPNLRSLDDRLSYVDLLSCVCKAFACVCLYVPCGHLLGKGLPLGSRSWCPTVTFPLVFWVRCDTWLYRFLIFAPLLTLYFRYAKAFYCLTPKHRNFSFSLVILLSASYKTAV